MPVNGSSLVKTYPTPSYPPAAKAATASVKAAHVSGLVELA
jgi:hypothetical protein